MALELGLKLVANTAGFTSQIDNAAKTLSQGLSKSLVETQNQLTNLNKAEAVSENSSKSLKAQFREMREELARMRQAGLQGTEAYKLLDQQAGKLQDTLQDASQSVKTLSSDTFAIDAGVQIVQGLAGAYQTYQGVLALTGLESEDAAKTMQKLMAVMSVAQGIQQVGIFLTEQSAAKKVIDTTITYAQSVAYRVLGASMATATTATRIFATAIATTGIGALVIGLSLAISKLMDFASSADEAKAAQDALTASLDQDLSRLRSQLTLYDRKAKAATASAKAEGASQAEISKIEEDRLRKRLAAINRTLADERSKGLENKKLIEDQANAELDLQVFLSERKADLLEDQSKKAKEELKKQLQQQKEYNDLYIRNQDELKKNLEGLKSNNLNTEIENARLVIEERRKLGRQFTDQEAAAFRLQQAKLYELEKKRIDDSYEAERAKILKLGPETSKLVKANLDQLKIQYDNAKLELKVKLGLDSSSIQSGVLKQFGNQKFDNSAFTNNLGDELKKQAEKDKKGIDSYTKSIESKLEEARSIISEGLQDALFNAADSLGSALAQGGSIGQALSAAGESILKVIGGVLQQLGKLLISVAVAVKLSLNSLKTLFANPAAALIAGIGLTIVGALLKNIKLIQTTAFAEGGIVTGPTMGLVGEAGKEAIIPLDRIGEVLGSIGGSQNVFVTGQLSGETIYLQQQRVSQRRGRFV